MQGLPRVANNRLLAAAAAKLFPVFYLLLFLLPRLHFSVPCVIVFSPAFILFILRCSRVIRKRRKKNTDKDIEKSTHTWDDIYDPSRPTLYEEYKDSEEKDQEVRDWRDRLYGRRRAFSSSDSEGERLGLTRTGGPH